MCSTLVVLQTSDLQQLNILHQGSTRLKVVCFDLSPSLILLGANSSTIYVLDHETLCLKNQIPAGNGDVVQLSISPDEHQVACALSNGRVMIFELQQTGAQLLTSSLEHYGHTVTSLVWASSQPELYIGDTSGRVSMLHVSKKKTASLFRSSCLHLMTLETRITQMDYQEGYLLVSTLTHSYVCNTNLETFSQVGTKLRQGEYGGCFCQVNQSSALSPFMKQNEEVEELQATLTSSEKFCLSDCVEAVEEDQVHHSRGLRRERPDRTVLPVLMSRVFCARPGTRIWEADHFGKVLVTHQLKSALMVSSAEVLCIDGSFGEQDLIEQIRLMSPAVGSTDNKLPVHTTDRSVSVKAIHPPVSVAFTKMLSFYNKYLLAISAYGLYIIDPDNSKVLVWVTVSEGISDIKVSGNSVIYKSSSGCIQNFMITTVDIAILVLHARGLFLECASLCLKNQDAFVKSELLSRLGANILADLTDSITSDVIKEKINELKSFVNSVNNKNCSINSAKLHVADIKNKNLEAEKIRAHLNIALKNNHQILEKNPVIRWNSEPHLNRNQTERIRVPVAHGILSMGTIPMWDGRKDEPYDETSTSLHVVPNHTTNEDALLSRPSEKFVTGLSSTSHRYSGGSLPHLGLEDNTSPCSEESDPFSPQKSLESSVDMFEDPLLTPEDSLPDPEAALQVSQDGHPTSTLSYASHNFYNLAYAPIHPGSEAAILLQDLMESVTSNMMNTFTTGTRALTERLTGVTPLVTPWVHAVPGIRNQPNTDQKTPPDTSHRASEVSSDSNTAIVIQSVSRRKQPRRQFSVPAAKHSSQVSLEEDAQQPELPEVVRSLHDLVCTTVQQMSDTADPGKARDLLSHWFEVFCHTVQQIQHDDKHSSPSPSENQAAERPISLSSMESSHSVGSANTSSDSLHWDSSDIGFEPSSMNIDIFHQITALFLKSMQAGVTASNLHFWITPQRADLPQHPMTPLEVRRQDALYSQMIASDSGLLQYSHILNSLESMGHHYYILTWTTLMEKITKDSNILTSQPEPEIISNLDFTRSQWVSFLHSLASSGNIENLITIAAQTESSVMIQDVIFLLQYMTAHPAEKGCSPSRAQLSKLLLQYLVEFSHHKSLTKAYLDSWCFCPELQSDILEALLSVASPSSTQFSCTCGLPRPHGRPVALEVLEQTILLHDIADPKGLAELCQTLGYWKGYCAINLTYCVKPSAQLFPYIVQTCNANLLITFLEVLHSGEVPMAFSTLARITSKDTNIMLCFKCQSKIPFPQKTHVIVGGSRQGDNCQDIANEGYSLTKNSFSESHLNGAVNKATTSNQLDLEAETVKDMRQLWEIVVTSLLRKAGAGEILKLLTSVEDDIPPGVLSERVYSWCILASMAEQRGAAARWALLDSLCGTMTKQYSHKVFQALHRHPSQQCNSSSVIGAPGPSWSEQVPVMAENPSSLPPGSTVTEELGNPAPLGHHWGVWAEVLGGVCSCCHLCLPTQALMSEGGITVLPCSHAFHTICLSHHGYQCIHCIQSHSLTTSH